MKYLVLVVCAVVVAVMLVGILSPAFKGACEEYWRVSEENDGLRESSTEDQGFEIVNIATRVTEKNDIWWRFAWRLTVKNRESHPISFQVTMEFQDTQGFIIDKDYVFRLHLGPNEKKVFTGSCTVDPKVAPQVAQTVAKVRLW